ncbi:MAG: N-acetylmuramoyl-L-alanine amidase [Bacteroidales bacterium]|nr:N-acetylmuramoyl-L-alanine amidase [Bacteroidales bacterium]MCM1415374.1 N-acetylmuramoyl-L-alanine amidase [bacterium]MCM1423307.1 N-acetylmuramoyl-L-alanine amidase [bacterium]
MSPNRNRGAGFHRSRLLLYNKIKIFATGMLFACLCLFSPVFPVSAQEVDYDDPEGVPVGQSDVPETPAKENIVVVIDPGHGGDQEGGMYDAFVEKDMTLITAKAMQAELEQYENVTVYLTRTEDKKLTLEERVDFAKSVDADFLFCLHYNLSADHNTLFGAECWVSAFDRYYSEGYSFADIEIKALEELGLFSRGIKTRLNDDGIDYYGIIRHAREQDLTCVLIEHCHMDHENDRPFCEGREQWEAFGRLDADCVAKYFHLRSETLGTDYRNYQTLEIPLPSGVVQPDRTEPDICMIEVTDLVPETGMVTVSLSAADYDSGMLYYDYSCDGGKTFSPRYAWTDKAADTITFTLQAPPHVIPQVMVRGYNGYDLYTESNSITLPSMDYKTEEEIAAELAKKEALEAAARAKEADRLQTLDADQKNYVEIHRTPKAEEETAPTVGDFLKICLVCALLVVGAALTAFLVLKSRRKRRRRRKRRNP